MLWSLSAITLAFTALAICLMTQGVYKRDLGYLFGSAVGPHWQRLISRLFPLVFLILPVTILFPVFPGIFVLQVGF